MPFGTTMKSFSRQTVSRVRALAELCYQRNLWVFAKDLLWNLSLGSRVIMLTLQRNFLESLIRRRACTEEIRVLATRITRGTKRNRAEEARIIELRVGNIEKEIRRAKNQWTKDSIKLKRALASMNWRFNQLKRVTLNEIWESEKERLRRKLQWILWKQRIALPREVEGIPIHEDDLREKFGDWQEEGVILGGLRCQKQLEPT